MARGVNRVILIGHVGQSPDVRYAPNGGAVANVSLATNESWKDKATGEKQERTEWHRVVFFGRLAEVVKEYVSKGAQIYIEGSLRTRKWQAKDGSDRYTTEVVADEMQMLGSRAGGGDAHSEEQAKPKPAAAASTATPDFDDDIPFDFTN